ncbi:MAG: uroporphyrinogen decarboxylase [Deltaproteobacteria bacterium]|nr:uroporphyrinogen decarboxylase [Deltaproteobacteria bacterium]
MDNKLILEERITRLRKAVSFKKPDRVPVVLEYSGFAAYVTGTPMADFISSPTKATQTMIKAFNCVGGGDGINYGSFSAHNLSYSFGAKVRVPGVDLPSNELWQVEETEIMTQNDYDSILDLGWKAFFKDYLSNRIFNDAKHELLPDNQNPVDVIGKWADNGIPVLSGGDVTLPFELLCGGRSLEKFFMDLINIPDKVKMVMDEIIPHLAKDIVQKASSKGYMMVWVGGWRTAPCMISPQMWDRFVWPYLKHLVNEVINAGLIPLLHLDSNWERELERFKAFPKGKIVVALDGDTNIFRAKEILDDHACIMGDVPAYLLAFGVEDEVYRYCTNLITNLGPDGFILQSGCDIPANAKLENVKAMVAAATGK